MNLGLTLKFAKHLPWVLRTKTWSQYGAATWASRRLKSRPLQWCHNHRRLDCLLNRLFRCRSKKPPNLRVTGLCEGNPTFDDVVMRLRQQTVCSHDPSDYQRMTHQSFHFMVLCEGNTRVSRGFSLLRASNMERVSMSWRQHETKKLDISHYACTHFISTILCHCNWYAYLDQMYKRHIRSCRK